MHGMEKAIGYENLSTPGPLENQPLTVRIAEWITVQAP